MSYRASLFHSVRKHQKKLGWSNAKLQIYSNQLFGKPLNYLSNRELNLLLEAIATLQV